jgi:hypothetical protein
MKDNKRKIELIENENDVPLDAKIKKKKLKTNQSKEGGEENNDNENENIYDSPHFLTYFSRVPPSNWINGMK